MHAISSNFLPSSCDHFEGGLGDFPHQEGTRILHIPPLPIDVSHVVKSPSLDFYTNLNTATVHLHIQWEKAWEISSHAVHVM